MKTAWAKNSTIKIANQRFVVHLHGQAPPCIDCSEAHDGSNLVPLTSTQPAGSAVSETEKAATSYADNRAKTKDEKWQDYKSDLKSLKASLLASADGGQGRGMHASGGGKRKAHAPGSVAEGSGQPISEGRGKASPEAQYLDRAKARRRVHGPSMPTPFLRTPTISAGPTISAPPVPVPPSYGPGQALFAKMMSGSGTAASAAPSLSSTSLHSSSALGVVPPPASEHSATQPPISMQPQRQMGKVVEVRTTERRGAGLGSGTMREGVESFASQAGPSSSGAKIDWRDTAKERRWKEVFPR